MCIDLDISTELPWKFYLSRFRLIARSSSNVFAASMEIVVRKFRLSARRFSNIFAAFLVALPVVFILRMLYLDSFSNLNLAISDPTISSDATDHNAKLLRAENSSPQFPSTKTHFCGATSNTTKDKLLGGLLHPGFDNSSCLSRYSSYLYRKISPHKPSRYLLSKLRGYEDLHRRCGPHTKSYKTTLKQLVSGNISSSTECNYVVWIAYSGLGNRILTITSAFLYALLSDRLLLIEQTPDMDDLFCEPFPNTSWLLPVDFPFRNEFNDFDQNYVQSFGNMLKYEIINISTNKSPQSYLYLHLAHDYDNHDKLFFCDEHQNFLKNIPWLIMRTDNYFIPSLFLMSSFKEELSKLFPNKETVFHYLGRYLFHPSNRVWGLVTRYYQAYMAKADERLGIQIRLFHTLTTPSKLVMDQLLSCTQREKLLPEVDFRKSVSAPAKRQISKAVLMTSLYSEYFENMTKMYWTHPTVTGEVIGIYQPSHERYQNSENNLHNMKAWAEMNLLSTCDVLVTSSWSTFGYVAQGLAGLKPWFLYKINKRKAPDPPCSRIMSMEPCFHAPPSYDCKAKSNVDAGTIVPHVRHCEDISWGVKLFNSHE